ncbi:MAG: PAS domain-containing protein [Myxococcales bacterium]|nr:PAS domain-containing protein [Myxococcales bacterium]
MIEEPLAEPASRPEVPEASGRRVSVGQWLVFLMVVLFVGPLLISNLWGYLQTRRYLTESSMRNLRTLAADEAAEADVFVRDAAKLVPSLLSGAPTLLPQISMAQGQGEGAGAARAALHEQLRVGVAGAPEMEELQVISASGAVLASSRHAEAPAPDLAAALCLQRGRQATAVTGYTPGEGAPAQMLVSTPASDGAVFCARFRLTAYQRLLTAFRRRSAAADLYLLDETRRVIASSSGGAHEASGERLSWLPRAQDLSEWALRTRGADGQDLVVAHSPVPGAGWGLVVTIPVAATLGELEALKRQALVMLASLLAVVALAVFLAWRTLVRPLRALSGAAERIAGGEIGATVSNAGPREISDLTLTFNRMSLALRNSQQTLEDRIASRTRSLHDSEQFLELLVNSIDQRVVVTDRDYRIVKANNAAVRMHGRPLLGELCHQAFEGRAAPCEGCPAARSFATGAPATAERSQHTVTGQEPVAIETYPVRAEDGSVESVIAISRVIGKEKQLQAKLAFQEKMAAFGQLATGVAHELGNPLAAIDAQLQRAQSDPQKAAISVPIVRKEVGRMSRLLRELVDFARRKRDEVRLASPNQAIEDVVKLMEHDPRARNVELVRELLPDLPGVRLVEDHLVQVLLNLGLNALDAIAQASEREPAPPEPPPRRLTFLTRVTSGDVEILVIDTGAGIPDEVAGRIFEPFYTTKAPGRGTGLGLFVSKRIVEDLGGSLTLAATGPGGTSFSIHLPTAPPPTDAR